MLLAHLRPADGCPFQVAALDQGTGKIALRPLEGAARAWVFQRLLRLTAGDQLLHAGLDRCLVARSQAEKQRGNQKSIFPVGAAPVSKLQLIPHEPAALAALRQMRAASQNILHLTAVSARVHERCAAGTPRNAKGKLQAGQAFL